MHSTVDKIKNYLSIKSLNQETYHLKTLRDAPEMSSILYSVQKAFEKGVLPEKVDCYTETSFFLRDEEGKRIAIFKTDRYIYEYIAYYLDHKRFANVPPTVITTLFSPIWGGRRVGACQLFIDDATAIMDIEREHYKHFLPSHVRRMAALDIRLLNNDRHSSNVLVREYCELIPIDHEFIFPSKIHVWGWNWMSWRQSLTRFSGEELMYISSLDPEKDRFHLIEECYVEEKVANLFFMTTVFLKAAAFLHLTPHQIGLFLKRKDRKDPCPTPFECLYENLKNEDTSNWRYFSKRVDEEIQKVLEKGI